MIHPADFSDIHAHLAEGADDAPEGVLVSLTPAEARRILAREGLRGRFTVGVHPWDAGDEVDWEEFGEFLRYPSVVGVGECGLDKLRGPSPERQEEVFRRQIELSERLRMPVILHVVKAIDTLLRLRKTPLGATSAPPAQQWILHGFRGNPIQAAQLLRAGIDLSLGTRCNPDVAATVPSGRLFNETDSLVRP